MAFVEALQQLGWTDGRNLQIETRWAGGRASDLRRHVTDLVALAPEVIIASGIVSLAALLQATHTVPIVFANVADPVGAGFVESMARPGGNATGFVAFEYTLSGKWLELLKEIAPSVTRTAVLRDPAETAGIGQFAIIQSVPPALGVDVTAINLRDAGDIERAVTAFAGSPNGGLIVASSGLAVTHSELIIALAAKHKLPAVYWRRDFVASGGLISYGSDIVQQFRGGGWLRGSHSQGREAERPTSASAVEVRFDDQSQDSEGPRPHFARADEVIE
jgi:putative ABC transport system substrate-binding protein